MRTDREIQAAMETVKKATSNEKANLERFKVMTETACNPDTSKDEQERLHNALDNGYDTAWETTRTLLPDLDEPTKTDAFDALEAHWAIITYDSNL